MKFSLNTKIIEPDNNENIDYAIILLHGYGGDGQDISMLTLGWKRFLKNTVFLCPDARESCAVNPAGYQWFDLNNEDSNKNVVEDLKRLNELYESGALTEEEFKKAKDKILN